MNTKNDLGTKFTCYKCSCVFYDLNKPEPLCPKCKADQLKAPVSKFSSDGHSHGKHSSSAKGGSKKNANYNYNTEEELESEAIGSIDYDNDMFEETESSTEDSEDDL